MTPDPKATPACICDSEDYLRGSCPVHDVPKDWKQSVPNEVRALNEALNGVADCFEEHHGAVDVICSHLAAKDAKIATLERDNEKLREERDAAEAEGQKNLCSDCKKTTRIVHVQRATCVLCGRRREENGGE